MCFLHHITLAQCKVLNVNPVSDVSPKFGRRPVFGTAILTRGRRVS